jgi:hypothetical protein
MAIVQDGKQPGTKIGAFFPQVNFPECMPEAILHEFVSSSDIARQSARVTRKTGNQGFDFPVKISVDRSSFSPAARRIGVLDVHICHPATALVSCSCFQDQSWLHRIARASEVR